MAKKVTMRKPANMVEAGEVGETSVPKTDPVWLCTDGLHHKRIRAKNKREAQKEFKRQTPEFTRHSYNVEVTEADG